MGKFVIEIKKEWCKACRICIDFCPNGVLGAGPDGKALVKDSEKCSGCMMCEYRCPDFAIRVSRYDASS